MYSSRIYYRRWSVSLLTSRGNPIIFARADRLLTGFSDLMTFRKLFTTHLARRWKCNSCGHTTRLEKYEETLFLPINIPKNVRKTPTNIIHGIKLALKSKSRVLDPRRGSISRTPPPHCQSQMEPETIVLNFPEILVLAVAVDESIHRMLVDVPYEKQLNLKELIGSKRQDTRLDRVYELMAGTAICSTRGLNEKTVAFARGSSASLLKNWFTFGLFPLAQEVLLEDLDTSQRVKIKDTTNLFPEMFVYMRTDTNGLGMSTQELRQRTEKYLQKYGPDSPRNIEDEEKDRSIISRGHSTELTHQVGNSELKFRINLATLHPGPNESIPFTLDIRYERPPKVGGGHSIPDSWVIEKKIHGRLVKGDDQQMKALADSPNELKPYYRFRNRPDGPTTPARLTNAEFYKEAARRGIHFDRM